MKDLRLKFWYWAHGAAERLWHWIWYHRIPEGIKLRKQAEEAHSWQYNYTFMNSRGEEVPPPKL